MAYFVLFIYMSEKSDIISPVFEIPSQSVENATWSDLNLAWDNTNLKDTVMTYLKIGEYCIYGSWNEEDSLHVNV